MSRFKISLTSASSSRGVRVVVVGLCFYCNIEVQNLHNSQLKKGKKDNVFLAAIKDKA
tara:strand:+ start:426 stop:599 length:174 start_codon:yes stop_codon:yes gene_type:complete